MEKYASLIAFTKGLVSVEFCSAIAGFATWHKWRNHYLKWFPIYLLIIVLFEVNYYVLLYIDEKNLGNESKNIAAHFEQFFISWFFSKILHVKHKKFIIISVSLYTIAIILENTLIKNDEYYFRSLSYTLGNLFILIYIILFFIEFANSDIILIFKKDAVFWIVCGMLLFYLGTFPYYGLYNELSNDLPTFIPIAWVATSLNYCMYLLFIIAFIWGRPR